eukprot:1983659-Prymnesium_polylepis.1
MALPLQSTPPLPSTVPATTNDHTAALEAFSDASARLDSLRKGTESQSGQDAVAFSCLRQLVKQAKACIDHRRDMVTASRGISRTKVPIQGDLRCTDVNASAIKLLDTSLTTVGTWPVEGRQERLYMQTLLKTIAAGSHLQYSRLAKLVNSGGKRRTVRDYFVAVRTVHDFREVCAQISRLLAHFAVGGVAELRKIEHGCRSRK